MAISAQQLTIYLYSAHRAVIFAIAQLSCYVCSSLSLVFGELKIFKFLTLDNLKRIFTPAPPPRLRLCWCFFWSMYAEQPSSLINCQQTFSV